MDRSSKDSAAPKGHSSVGKDPPKKDSEGQKRVQKDLSKDKGLGKAAPRKNSDTAKGQHGPEKGLAKTDSDIAKGQSELQKSSIKRVSDETKDQIGLEKNGKEGKRDSEDASKENSDKSKKSTSSSCCSCSSTEERTLVHIESVSAVSSYYLPDYEPKPNQSEYPSSQYQPISARGSNSCCMLQMYRKPVRWDSKICARRSSSCPPERRCQRRMTPWQEEHWGEDGFEIVWDPSIRLQPDLAKRRYCRRPTPAFMPIDRNMETLRLLLGDNTFRDYFNIFLNLPCFGPHIALSVDDQPFTFKAPLEEIQKRVGWHQLLTWLSRNRLPQFRQSSLYTEYCLCLHLRSRLVNERRPFVLTSTGDVTGRHALRKLMAVLLGHAMGMRLFRVSLRTTRGAPVFDCWLALEQLRQIKDKDEFNKFRNIVKQKFMQPGGSRHMDGYYSACALKEILSFKAAPDRVMKECRSSLKFDYHEGELPANAVLKEPKSIEILQKYLLHALSTYWAPHFALRAANYMGEKTLLEILGDEAKPREPPSLSPQVSNAAAATPAEPATEVEGRSAQGSNERIEETMDANEESKDSSCDGSRKSDDSLLPDKVNVSEVFEISMEPSNSLPYDVNLDPIPEASHETSQRDLSAADLSLSKLVLNEFGIYELASEDERPIQFSLGSRVREPIPETELLGASNTETSSLGSSYGRRFRSASETLSQASGMSCASDMSRIPAAMSPRSRAITIHAMSTEKLKPQPKMGDKFQIRLSAGTISSEDSVTWSYSDGKLTGSKHHPKTKLLDPHSEEEVPKQSNLLKQRMPEAVASEGKYWCYTPQMSDISTQSAPCGTISPDAEGADAYLDHQVWMGTFSEIQNAPVISHVGIGFGIGSSSDPRLASSESGFPNSWSSSQNMESQTLSTSAGAPHYVTEVSSTITYDDQTTPSYIEYASQRLPTPLTLPRGGFPSTSQATETTSQSTAKAWSFRANSLTDDDLGHQTNYQTRASRAVTSNVAASSFEAARLPSKPSSFSSGGAGKNPAGRPLSTDKGTLHKPGKSGSKGSASSIVSGGSRSGSGSSFASAWSCRATCGSVTQKLRDSDVNKLLGDEYIAIFPEPNSPGEEDWNVQEMVMEENIRRSTLGSRNMLPDLVAWDPNFFNASRTSSESSLNTPHPSIYSIKSYLSCCCNLADSGSGSSRSSQSGSSLEDLIVGEVLNRGVDEIGCRPILTQPFSYLLDIKTDMASSGPGSTEGVSTILAITCDKPAGSPFGKFLHARKKRKLRMILEFWEHAIEFFGMAGITIISDTECIKGLLRKAMIEKYLMQKIFPESESKVVKMMITSLQKENEAQFVELSRQIVLKHLEPYWRKYAWEDMRSLHMELFPDDEREDHFSHIFISGCEGAQLPYGTVAVQELVLTKMIPDPMWKGKGPQRMVVKCTENFEAPRYMTQLAFEMMLQQTIPWLVEDFIPTFDHLHDRLNNALCSLFYVPVPVVRYPLLRKMFPEEKKIDIRNLKVKFEYGDLPEEKKPKKASAEKVPSLEKLLGSMDLGESRESREENLNLAMLLKEAHKSKPKSMRNVLESDAHSVLFRQKLLTTGKSTTLVDFYQDVSELAEMSLDFSKAKKKAAIQEKYFISLYENESETGSPMSRMGSGTSSGALTDLVHDSGQTSLSTAPRSASSSTPSSRKSSASKKHQHSLETVLESLPSGTKKKSSSGSFAPSQKGSRAGTVTTKEESLQSPGKKSSTLSRASSEYLQKFLPKKRMRRSSKENISSVLPPPVLFHFMTEDPAKLTMTDFDIVRSHIIDDLHNRYFNDYVNNIPKTVRELKGLFETTDARTYTMQTEMKAKRMKRWVIVFRNIISFLRALDNRTEYSALDLYINHLIKEREVADEQIEKTVLPDVQDVVNQIQNLQGSNLGKPGMRSSFAKEGKKPLQHVVFEDESTSKPNMLPHPPDVARKTSGRSHPAAGYKKRTSIDAQSRLDEFSDEQRNSVELEEGESSQKYHMEMTPGGVIYCLEKARADLGFIYEVQRYVQLIDGLKESEDLQPQQGYTPFSFGPTNLELQTQKANVIISCYIDSPHPPPIQINIPKSLARRIVDSYNDQGPVRQLLHEAYVSVFPIVYGLWKRFRSDWGIRTGGERELRSIIAVMQTTERGQLRTRLEQYRNREKELHLNETQKNIKDGRRIGGVKPAQESVQAGQSSKANSSKGASSKTPARKPASVERPTDDHDGSKAAKRSPLQTLAKTLLKRGVHEATITKESLKDNKSTRKPADLGGSSGSSKAAVPPTVSHGAAAWKRLGASQMKLKRAINTNRSASQKRCPSIGIAQPTQVGMSNKSHSCNPGLAATLTKRHSSEKTQMPAKKPFKCPVKRSVSKNDSLDLILRMSNTPLQYYTVDSQQPNQPRVLRQDKPTISHRRIQSAAPRRQITPTSPGRRPGTAQPTPAFPTKRSGMPQATASSPARRAGPTRTTTISPAGRPGPTRATTASPARRPEPTRVATTSPARKPVAARATTSPARSGNARCTATSPARRSGPIRGTTTSPAGTALSAVASSAKRPVTAQPITASLARRPGPTQATTTSPGGKSGPIRATTISPARRSGPTRATTTSPARRPETTQPTPSLVRRSGPTRATTASPARRSGPSQATTTPPERRSGPTQATTASPGRRSGPSQTTTTPPGRRSGPTRTTTASPGRRSGPTRTTTASPGRRSGPTRTTTASPGRRSGPSRATTASPGRRSGPTQATTASPKRRSGAARVAKASTFTSPRWSEDDDWRDEDYFDIIPTLPPGQWNRFDQKGPNGLRITFRLKQSARELIRFTLGDFSESSSSSSTLTDVPASRQTSSSRTLDSWDLNSGRSLRVGAPFHSRRVVQAPSASWGHPPKKNKHSTSK